MYKKIIIILSALIALSLPFQQQYAEGAIFSKVASAGAKKAVKEIVKESAFDAAVNIFLDEAYSMALEDRQKYQAQQDYELFCGKKMPDLITCEKPMQAKKVLTAADKVNIGNQAEIELDKLITNGAGFTKWQKFLDWFVPIWVASFALTAITYAIDPDVRSLFNEAGYNALVALGLIVPVVSKEESVPLKDINLEMVTKTEDTPTHRSLAYVTNSASSMAIMQQVNYPMENTILETYWYAKVNPSITLLNHSDSLNGQTLYIHDRLTFDLFNSTLGTVYQVTGAKNGLSIQTIIPVANGFTDRVQAQFTAPELSNSLYNKQTTSVRTRLPYKIGDFYYTDVLYNTVSGDTYEWQIKHSSRLTGNFTTWNSGFVHSTAEAKNTRITAYFNQSPNKKILPPAYGEIETELDLMKQSKYANENGEVALVPPSALPYIQTSTGIQLTPEIDENGEMKFTTPTGESVPEDDITVGDPNIQENPAPSPNTVTPPSTQNNPNPEPIPLTPTTPPPPPPPTETLPPVFPEGESCEVGLKLPKISPLAYAVSEAFPFSIPFDLYDGFQAIFSEMGNEKPEFNYKLDFMGEQQEWKISIPDYFDSWKRFTDSFIIFIFDVGIIFMIFRFMGGSK